MSPGNRPTGRQKKIVSGGGNAYRRGSGLGGGPVGGGSGGSFGGSGSGLGGGDRGSGSRGGGGSLLAILAAILIGKAASGGGSSSGSGNGGASVSRSGCLKRIVILVIAIVVISWLARTCSGSGSSLLGGLTGGYDTSGGAYSDNGGLTEVEVPDTSTTVPSTTQSVDASSLEQLLGSVNGTTASVSTTSESAYKAHAPNYDVDSAARDRYTTLQGNGQDTVTVMVYMCGADLESKSGMGTSDLQEMVSAQFGDNVRIVLETGGASRWQNNIISANTCQIYEVRQGGLKRVEANVGKKPMVDPNTLTEFIKYSAQRYPADRYALIMWDHGGGSIAGYGYDELFSASGSMRLDQFDEALEAAGCKFDFIGFDACLMAGLETALVAEKHADYLISSEATEPGTGWYYTTWITKLGDDTSMSTVDIGKQIIDDFVKYSQTNAPSSSATLSLIDLAELDGTVPASFKQFATSTTEMIANDEYQTVATARSGAKDFSVSSKINQIDLIHFAENMNTDASNALANTLRSCVKYNRIGTNISHANGVSIYFPYNSLSSVSSAVSTYDKIGIDDSYTKCISDFASMAAGGSVFSGGSSDALGSLLGGGSSGSLLGSLLGASSSADTSSASSYGSADMMTTLLSAMLSGRDLSAVTGDSDNSWMNKDLLTAKQNYFQTTANAMNFANLMLTQKDGHTVLEMTEDQWAFVQTLEQNVFLDDGEGYIDLGLDTVMDWTDDGSLMMDYDGTWLSLNGQIVAYYFISMDQIDDGYVIRGRVPAMLNGERVNIILVFDSENPDGYVAGAMADYEETTDVSGKGLTDIQAGDKIDFLCDYYTYDGTYSDTYELGEQMIATDAWVIGNAPVGNDNYRMTYRITDIYNAQYWTPSVTGK